MVEESSDYYKRAGNRNTNGSFNNQGTNANFWSSSVSGSNAWNRNLNSGNSTVNRNPNNQANGFSVRCLQDWSKGAIYLAPFVLANNILCRINF